MRRPEQNPALQTHTTDTPLDTGSNTHLRPSTADDDDNDDADMMIGALQSVLFTVQFSLLFHSLTTYKQLHYNNDVGNNANRQQLLSLKH